MIYTVAILIFAVVANFWLEFELKKKVPMRAHLGWLVAALILPILASVAAFIVGERNGNIILHAVGGGVSSCLLFFYLLKAAGFRPNWRVELVALFGFVSGLGVLNELAEYVFELINLGIFSYDTHDPWRDLTANSLGALLAWLVIRSFSKLIKS